MPSHAWALAFALAATVIVPSLAHADEQTDLEKARVAYLARRYDEADDRFRAMLDPVSGTLHDPALVSRARMYWGAVLLAQKQSSQAASIFEKLLLDDPTFEPDPLSFPADVVNTFIDVRARMRERLSALAAEQARRDAEARARDVAEKLRQDAHLQMVERLASEEKVTDRHSRWVALLPFGVGQFQNGDKALGWAFLGTEAALIIGAAIALPVYTTQYHDGFVAYGNSDPSAGQYLDRANTARYVNITLLSVALGIAGAGIIEAEAVYKPDVVEIKKRPLPSAWTIAPDLNPRFGEGRAGGAGGVGGTAGFTIRF